MYYLIKGKIEDDFGCGTFEWVVEATTKEEAVAKLEDGEQLESIREISVVEGIEREERELLKGVKGEYISRIMEGLTLREAAKKSKELDTNQEIYYLALKSFNQRQRLAKLLKKNELYKDWTVGEFEEKIKQLSQATTEDEFNKILEA